MHITVTDLSLVIDIGTSLTTSVTMVNIAGAITGPITIDAIICNVDLSPVNGAAEDYAANSTVGSSYGPSFSPAYYNASNADLTYNIGVVGISNIKLTVPSFNLAISALSKR
jgi:hypothetical protein